MIKIIYKYLQNSKLFNFNVNERDAWVEIQARTLPKGTKVIDVGAGSSPYKKYFDHCIYKTQDFAQLSAEQLRGQQGYAPIDYVSLANHIPVEDNSFDAAVCTEVLEHVPNPIEVVFEIGRILKTGGKAIITAPLNSHIHQEPYHFYGGYSNYWYEKYLEEAGFKDIAIKPNGNFFKFYGQETQRFIVKSNPFQLKKNVLFRLLWLPFWICLVPFWFIAPIIGRLFDSADQSGLFTIGFHVIATKK